MEKEKKDFLGFQLIFNEDGTAQLQYPGGELLTAPESNKAVFIFNVLKILFEANASEAEIDSLFNQLADRGWLDFFLQVSETEETNEGEEPFNFLVNILGNTEGFPAQDIAVRARLVKISFEEIASEELEFRLCNCEAATLDNLHGYIWESGHKLEGLPIDSIQRFSRLCISGALSLSFEEMGLLATQMRALGIPEKRMTNPFG
jgi:hypothetical protein